MKDFAVSAALDNPLPCFYKDDGLVFWFSAVNWMRMNEKGDTIMEMADSGRLYVNDVPQLPDLRVQRYGPKNVKAVVNACAPKRMSLAEINEAQMLDF